MLKKHGKAFALKTGRVWVGRFNIPEMGKLVKERIVVVRVIKGRIVLENGGHICLRAVSFRNLNDCQTAEHFEGAKPAYVELLCF